MNVSLKKSAFPKSLCCSSMLECLIRMSSNTSVFIVTHFQLYQSVLSSPFHYTCAAFNYFIIVIVIIILLSWSSSVSIVSDYRLNDRVSVSSRGKMIFHLASLSRPNLRPIQHPLQWVPGVLFRGGGGSLAGAWRRPLTPSSAEVKNK
jgi:hypothetical protein